MEINFSGNGQEFIDSLIANDFDFLDIRYTDMEGSLHHITFLVSMISKDDLEDGIYIDGSSMKGWCGIEKSDILLKADLTTAYVDPFTSRRTVAVLGDIILPNDGGYYSKSPRAIARKALDYLTTSDLADTAYFGAEPEFFIFDDVQFEVKDNRASFVVDSLESPNAQQNPNLMVRTGNTMRCHGGYAPVLPLDVENDLRGEMLLNLKAMGLRVNKHHHEVTPGQHEVGLEFATLLKAADDIVNCKYGIRATAALFNKSATFMPKPIYGDNGSGMHVHQSLWFEGVPLFAGDGYEGLSDTAIFYIGGIIKHAKSLNAFTNPTTNSYKRLVPGFEAPVNLAYSASNRSAAIRIPLSSSAKAKRIEVRFSDPLANPYLAFSAMLMAGIDGIVNKIHPGEATDKNLYKLDKELKNNIPSVSLSLREALESLANDNEYLLRGDVFSKEFICSYIDVKMKDVIDFEHHPHPVEFSLYYNK